MSGRFFLCNNNGCRMNPGRVRLTLELPEVKAYGWNFLVLLFYGITEKHPPMMTGVSVNHNLG